VIKAAAADNSNSMPWLFHARDGGWGWESQVSSLKSRKSR
jgi:hypothetical protein